MKRMYKPYHKAEIIHYLWLENRNTLTLSVDENLLLDLLQHK